MDGKRRRPPVSRVAGAGSSGARGGNPNDDIAHRLAEKENELKKKLSAFASFNQSERDLLKQAFAVVSRERGGVPGLCARDEFAEVFDRLDRLSPR